MQLLQVAQNLQGKVHVCKHTSGEIGSAFRSLNYEMQV